MNCRAIAILLILSVIAVTGLMATQSRMTTLGNPTRVGFVRDLTDIFYFPGAMNYYPNTILAELDYPYSKEDWQMYANLPFMDYVFGLYLNIDTGLDDADWLFGDHYDYESGMLDIGKGIGLGFGFNDHLGVILKMAIDSSTIPIDTNNDLVLKASAYSLSGGYSTEIIDLGLNVGLFAASMLNELDKEEYTTTGITLGFNGRYFIIDDRDFTAMALMGFEFSTGSREHKNFPGYTPENNTRDAADFSLHLDLGVGVNFNIDDHNKVIAGIKPFIFELYTYEDYWQNDFSETYIFLPEYQVALESRITKWLTGRVGARQVYGWATFKDEPSQGPSWADTYYVSYFDMNLGLGFNFGNFTIDTVLKPDFLFNGPEFIGGNASGIASQVSVKYTF